jgi:hypothetical protein
MYMESPFTSSSTIVFYLEPVLNSFNKTYQQIITLNTQPKGPLSEFVSVISPPKLSPFQQFGPMSSPTNCVRALMRYPKHGDNSRITRNHAEYFMMADDIPSVFSYLVDNGYTIEQDLTQMMQTSGIQLGGVSNSRLSGNRKMICMASYSV